MEAALRDPRDPQEARMPNHGGQCVELPTDLLGNVFEFAGGRAILTRLVLVCRTWASAGADEALWRRLVARRWEHLHGLPADTLDSSAISLDARSAYDLRDVYFRLVARPTSLVSKTRLLALSAPADAPLAGLTEARFMGRQLGGNQTVVANLPWASSALGTVHGNKDDDLGFATAPVATLRPVMSSSAPVPRLVAALEVANYFEVTIFPAPQNHPSLASGSGWHGRPCVAVGMCTSRFPVVGKMPGWDRHSFAYHGDDGCKFRDSTYGDPYGPPFGVGDVVGCGVRVRAPGLDGEEEGARVFFTLNGTLLDDPCIHLGYLAKEGLRACVGVDTFSPVRVNLGQEPFAFDIASLANVLPRSSQLTLPSPVPGLRQREGAQPGHASRTPPEPAWHGDHTGRASHPRTPEEVRAALRASWASARATDARACAGLSAEHEVINALRLGANPADLINLLLLGGGGGAATVHQLLDHGPHDAAEGHVSHAVWGMAPGMFAQAALDALDSEATSDSEGEEEEEEDATSTGDSDEDDQGDDSDRAYTDEDDDATSSSDHEDGAAEEEESDVGEDGGPHPPWTADSSESDLSDLASDSGAEGGDADDTSSLDPADEPSWGSVAAAAGSEAGLPWC
mmetsp:Transcript_5931/g.16175  ORF Transcript_5931/g.16175 Transcript_5931/m.16175 type:complete len:627 (-) Transcript_5931:358-2238(-)